MVDTALGLRVLGPLEVLRGGRSIAPAGVRRRSLLALLLLEAGHVVSVERLVDGIWGEQPPAQATGLVQTYVSLWRGVLREGAVADEPERLVREGRGYRVVVLPGELDLEVARGMAEGGRAALAADDGVRAADLLGRALSQWRGEALADLAGEPFHAGAAHRLDELRRAVLLDWAAAVVACGRAQDAIVPLTAALEREPLEEPVAEVLARTLYGLGRASEALAVLERTRVALADALGVDPGERLAALHLQVLRQDPALSTSAHAAAGATLPMSHDSFVGREATVAEVAKLLGEHRLVTLTGAGGSGKTRLAVEVAHGQGERFVGGLCFVDASQVTTAGELPDRVVGALGARVPGGQTVWEVLAAATAEQPSLLVLDNCEQVAGTSGVVTRMLAATAHLNVLATSREPLHAQGEQRFPLAGLAVGTPDRTSNASPPSPAVRLFCDRAAAVDPGSTFDRDNLDDVARICRRLDGLPLAIELAAGWVRLLPPRRLLAALEESLDVLRSEHGERPARQRTLRATMDWSYALLSVPAQGALRALSVFRAGFTTDAATAVTDQPRHELLLVLRHLRETGLLDVDTHTDAQDEPRYRLLQTVRDYGGEHLTAEGEQQEAKARHAAFFVDLAEREGRRLTGRGQTSAVDALAADRDDVAAALRWMVRYGDADRALLVAALLWRFWHLRSHLDEGRRLVTDLLESAGLRADMSVRARADLCLGNIAYWQMRHQEALEHYTWAATVFRDLDDVPGLAEALYDRGFALHQLGQTEQGQASLTEALDRYRDLDDTVGQAHAASALAFGLCNLGRLNEAAALAQDSLVVLRERADSFAVANTVGLLGMIRWVQGQLSEAEPLLHEALAAHAEAGHATGITWMLRGIAALALACDDPRRALRLAAAAEVLEPDRQGSVPLQILGLPDVRAEATRLLPTAEVTRLWDAGRALSMDEAVREALHHDPNCPSP